MNIVFIPSLFDYLNPILITVGLNPISTLRSQPHIPGRLYACDYMGYDGCMHDYVYDNVDYIVCMIPGWPMKG